MRIDRTRARGELERGEFQRLFIEELGWNRAREGVKVQIGDAIVAADAVAEKAGFKAFVVRSPVGTGMLPIADRRTVRDQLSVRVRENLIVFLSDDGRTQIWQWTRRELDKPIALREHVFTAGQTGESLLQRLEHLVVTIEEEQDERITILDVAQRAKRTFDVERPSRRFFDRFQSEHAAFLDGIAGIEANDDRAWYASVMLNRLIFVYFIQKKGFLADDTDYLRTRMRMMQEEEGPDRFQRFYRQFLLRLFFDGLGGQRRTDELDRLIGRVPYLNGGMFVEHFLEQTHDINIPDAAFEAVLDFFDEFDWHLDDRPVQKDNEINPDVLGYIFERYINNKQLGAYYTKEDVTEYIARSTVVPRLLDLVAVQTPNAFRADGLAWAHLRSDPDRYVFPSMTVGADASIPAGMNMTAPEAAAELPEGEGLPRETWRGLLDRLDRRAELRAILSRGDVTTTDALVTLNLDVRQFAQDLIERADDPGLIDAFYRSLSEISVLDPTCGSGAFLFAVLNVLEPIYEATLDRMEAFLDEAGRTGWLWNASLRNRFSAIVAEANTHRNRKYFVFRSIVVNNLFGVDIMEEAVEICKLRLFLKLASQIDEQEDIEPLPDIDFNVRSGNALIGYTAHPTGRDKGFDLTGTGDELDRQAADLNAGYARYRSIQFGDRSAAAELKRSLVGEEDVLSTTLNRRLGERYSARTPAAIASWAASHQPFHWWAAFYQQMGQGGFDVIVGNPPYVPSAKVRREYTVLDLETERAADIYAWVVERSADLLAAAGRSGMVVPLSLTFSSRFASLRDVLARDYAANWYSSFGRIPSALFAYDVRVRNTIHVGRKAARGERGRTNFTGRLHRWFEQERRYLFQTLAFTPFAATAWGGLVPKVHTPKLVELFERERARHTPTIESLTRRTGRDVLHFKKSAYNWLNFCRELPPCYDRSGALIPHTEFGTVAFASKDERDLAFLLLNGKWQYANWYMIGDDFHVTIGMFEGLPAPMSRLTGEQRAHALDLAAELDLAMRDAISFKLNAGKRVGNYNLARCRHVTDRSDRLFAQAFGWTDAWPEVELLYSQAVKTTYEVEDEGADD